jgi:hypothetical protein
MEKRSVAARETWDRKSLHAPPTQARCTRAPLHRHCQTHRHRSADRSRTQITPHDARRTTRATHVRLYVLRVRVRVRVCVFPHPSPREQGPNPLVCGMACTHCPHAGVTNEGRVTMHVACGRPCASQSFLIGMVIREPMAAFTLSSIFCNTFGAVTVDIWVRNC